MSYLIALAAGEPVAVLSTQTAIILAVAFLVGAVVFFFLELLFPSFGLLTICGLACAGGSWICAFSVGRWTGATFVVLSVLAIPAVVLLAFKLLPRSPLVVRSVIASTVPEPEPQAIAPGEDRAALVGKAGVAITRLNPGGTARIDGGKYDVVSPGDFIEPSTPIEVVSVDGHHIEVKAREV